MRSNPRMATIFPPVLAKRVPFATGQTCHALESLYRFCSEHQTWNICNSNANCTVVTFQKILDVLHLYHHSSLWKSSRSNHQCCIRSSSSISWTTSPTSTSTSHPPKTSSQPEKYSGSSFEADIYFNGSAEGDEENSAHYPPENYYLSVIYT